MPHSPRRVFEILEVNIRKRDRHKTAFFWNSGRSQCIRMPFGVMDVPACLQRIIDLILTRLKCTKSLIHLYDVTIFYSTMVTHIRHFD